jgi:hypothetical protein
MKNVGIKISLALVGATALYFIGKAIFKKGGKGNGSGSGDEEGGGTYEDEQTRPNPTLSEALKNGTAVGKKIYTKVNNANIRYTAEINNGWMDNIWSTVPNAGTYLGTIYDVFQSTDTRILNPNTNEPYYWVILDLDSTLWKTLNDEKSVLNPDKQNSKIMPCKVNKCVRNYWMREDIIKL